MSDLPRNNLCDKCNVLLWLLLLLCLLQQRAAECYPITLVFQTNQHCSQQVNSTRVWSEGKQEMKELSKERINLIFP